MFFMKARITDLEGPAVAGLLFIVGALRRTFFAMLTTSYCRA
jgi:hypothetical protein